MSFVNKNKIFLEPTKHINEKARKLLHQAREINTENRIPRSKIKSSGIIVSRNYPITDYYKFFHDKNQSDHNYRFFHVSHQCNYGLIAFLATNQI